MDARNKPGHDVVGGERESAQAFRSGHYSLFSK